MTQLARTLTYANNAPFSVDHYQSLYFLLMLENYHKESIHIDIHLEYFGKVVGKVVNFICSTIQDLVISHLLELVTQVYH